MIMLRNLLRETVFMRLLISFILGIIAYELTLGNLSFLLLLTTLLLTIFLLLIFLYLISKRNITFKFHNGLLVFLLCFNFAFLLSYFEDSRNSRDYHRLLSQNIFYVEIKNGGRISGKNIIYDASIKSNTNSDFKTILSLKSNENKFNIGDYVQLKSTLSSIDKQQHPGQFDYKYFLSKKQVYHRIQTDDKGVLQHWRDSTINIKKASDFFRNKLLSILKYNIHDSQSYEMAAALLLGERSNVDENVMKSYRDTGTIHIISVSGLHVGIIFLVIQSILKLIPLFKNEIVKCCMIIISIWFYSLLTGLPASVIRSATMISFHVIGKTISSKSNSINHVAASALFLLSFSPSYLFDIGFQLSYLAVYGIIYLQKTIENWFYFKNKIAEYIWTMMAVSIAAQLFTLPFCLYYFHQFPNYFLIANILAIPLSSLALYTSISNLLFAYIPILNRISEWILTNSIFYLNKFLMGLASIPGAVSKFEPISIIEALLYCVILFFLLLYLKEKIRIGLRLAFYTLIILSLFVILKNQTHHHEHLWEFKQRFNKLYSLERVDSIIHFIPEKTSIKTIRRLNNNWKNISTKKQKFVLIPGWNFELVLHKKSYTSKLDSNSYKKSPYRKLCL